MAVASSSLGVMAVFLCPILSSAVSLQRQTATSASASIGPDLHNVMQDVMHKIKYEAGTLQNLQGVMHKIKNCTSSDEIKRVLQREGHSWVPGPVPPKSPDEANFYNTILSWSYGYPVDFYPIKKKIYETVPKELADAAVPLIWAVVFTKGDMNKALTTDLEWPAIWAQPIKDAAAAANFTEVLSSSPLPGPVPPKDPDETNFYNTILSWSYGYPVDFYPVKKKIYETLPKELADAAVPLIWVVVLTKGNLIKTLTTDLAMPANVSIPILDAVAAANFTQALPTSPPNEKNLAPSTSPFFSIIAALVIAAIGGSSASSMF